MTKIKDKSNRLTLTEIQSQGKEFTKRKKVVLAGKYNEEIDIKFSKSKIQMLIIDYLRLLKQQEEITPKYLLDSQALFNTLIIKHFSTIELPDVTSVEDLITVSNTLYDMGILDDLFDFGENSFSKEQTEVLTKALDKTTAKITENTEVIIKQSAELDVLIEKAESEINANILKPE